MPSSTDLLDANVWLALAVEAHTHHRAAKDYWENQAAPVAAFCRVTQLAFLRHLTNKTIMGKMVLTPSAAWEKCCQFLALPEVGFRPEPMGLEVSLGELSHHGWSSPNGWTDVYLCAFAKCARMRLVTFDHGFSRFSGLELLTLSGSPV